VELREGAEHQAAVPPLQQAKPAGACTDPRAGESNSASGPQPHANACRTGLG
jgi:hypothetical protein